MIRNRKACRYRALEEAAEKGRVRPSGVVLKTKPTISRKLLIDLEEEGLLELVVRTVPYHVSPQGTVVDYGTITEAGRDALDHLRLAEMVAR